jgi:hypothetical protein
MKRTIVGLLLAATAGAAAAPSMNARLDRAYDAVVSAQEALQVAKKRRDNGAAPLPGERVGIADGGSRLRPEYFDRQRKLKRGVNKARKNLDAALERWNAVK